MSAETFLKAQAQAQRNALRCAFVAGVLVGAVVIVQAWLLSTILAGVVFHQQTWADVAGKVYLLIALALLRLALEGGSSTVLAYMGRRVQHHLRQSLLNHIQQLGPVYVTRQGTGRLLTMLMEGVAGVVPYYTRYLPARMLSTAVPLAMLAAVLPLDHVAGLTLLLTAPLIPVFMIFVGKGTQQRNQEQWQQLARLGNHLLDAIRGLPVLKMFQAAQREQAAVAAMAELYRQKTMRVLRIAFLSSLVLEFFATVSIALVAVFIGFRLLWGTFDYQTGLFILLLAPEFYLPLRVLGGAYHARMEAIGAAENMAELMAEPLPVFGTKSPPTEDISVEFHNVSFAYGNTGVLEKVSLTLASGTHTALVGPTGVGKSTVMNLLLGFIQPTAGHITVNGIPLTELDIAVWRQQIGWVPQQPHLFAGTVLENLQIGRPELTLAEAQTICRHLQADTFIQALPQGYHTQVGEGGMPLSVGQMQRLALARAFARNAPFILLDEPTAGLDRTTEAAVLTGIESLSAGKTVLTIAHRLNTLQQATTTLQLANGQLVTEGKGV